MYTCYQVVLIAEDGEYPQQDFQTEDAAWDYVSMNRADYGEGQELTVNPIYRGF